MAHFLVTGGAGYIGSHFAYYAMQQGHEVTIIDSLVTGHKETLEKLPPHTFYPTDLNDTAALEGIFSAHHFDAVFHFAGLIQVGESVQKPLEYYQNITTASISLIDVCLRHQVNRFIFSSTAAVYGEPKEQSPIKEDDPTNPTSPYGNAKRIVERVLEDTAHTHPYFAYCIFRYFNVVGGFSEVRLGETHEPETHIIPRLILDSLNLERPFTLFGDTYHTKDGTCIRDYIDIGDLVRAHMLGYEWITQHQLSTTLNLGRNQSYTNLEILKCVSNVLGREIPYTIAEPRAGDPAYLLADSTKAQNLLGWHCEIPLEESIRNCIAFIKE